MASIGLRPYLIELYDNQEHEQIPLAKSGRGATLFELLPAFQAAFGKGNAAQAESKAVHLENLPPEGRSFHGWMKYGTSGIDSVITDGENGDELFKRSSNHFETLPLYFRIWVPEEGASAIAVLQSYETRSCASQFLNMLREYYEFNHQGTRLLGKKVMPNPKQALANADVKKVRFYRRNLSSDKANNISLGGADYFHLELIMHARRYGAFGKLNDMINKLGDGALVYEGIEFESATAEVKIGNEKRRVGLINASNMAGVVDITGDIELIDGRADPSVISAVAENLIIDLRAEYGI